MKKKSCSIFKFWLPMVIIICLFSFVAVSNNPLLTPAVANDNNDNTYKSLKLFTDVLEELEKNYVDDVNSEELINNAIQGMVGNLDPHSSFMNMMGQRVAFQLAQEADSRYVIDFDISPGIYLLTLDGRSQRFSVR